MYTSTWRDTTRATALYFDPGGLIPVRQSVNRLVHYANHDSTETMLDRDIGLGYARPLLSDGSPVPVARTVRAHTLVKHSGCQFHGTGSLTNPNVINELQGVSATRPKEVNLVDD